MPNPNRGSCGFQSREFEQEYERPSKSQLKREMTALQKLGEELVAAPRDRIGRVPMPEDLRDAILACRQIRDHEGRRRQLQYIGKKMRTLEEDDIAAIRNTLDSWRGLSKVDTAALHALERDREQLLKDDRALTDLLSRRPDLDAQRLRALIRNARRERTENRPPRAYREIFQMLRQLQEPSNAAAAAENQADEREN